MNFSVLTYNILDFNLASNSVPRTMDFDSFNKIKTIDIIPEGKTPFTVRNDKSGKPIVGLVNTLNNEYSSFFHNHTKGTQDKNIKRKLWGQNITSIEEFASFISTFGDQPQIVYLESNTFNIAGEVVKNLKGILDLFFTHMGMANDPSIYARINSYDTEISDWSIRGRKISEKILASSSDIVMLQEYGSCHDKPFAGGITLPQSLSHIYDCLFFLNPKFKETDAGEKDGVAIYYKKGVFELVPSDAFLAEKSSSAEAVDIFRKVKKIENTIFLDMTSNTSDFKCLHSFDVDARSSLDTPEKIADRRSVGFAKLKFLKTSHDILFITSHLMTDSKDKDGAIKIQELQNVQDYICESLGRGNIDLGKDGIVFGGDFNIIFNSKGTAYGDRNIFGKGIPGFVGVMDTPCGIQLIDTLIDQIGNIGRISSVNNTRKDWIDYIFYYNLKHLETTYDDVSEIYIPNADHPSDHIPIKSIFSPMSLEGGYYEKYLKYKQKYINLKKQIK